MGDGISYRLTLATDLATEKNSIVIHGVAKLQHELATTFSDDFMFRH